MDYDLTRLGEREFEHLCQAIAVRVLGPGLQIFGDGPDGGREATFDGPVNYPSESGSAQWDGYGVLQAKYKRKTVDTSKDAQWFLEQLRRELGRWSQRLERSGGKTIRRPQYFIFATNVYLSGVPTAGGLDRANEAIQSKSASLGIKGWAIWSGDNIARMLDSYPEIRQSYRGFITPGDVLARVINLLPEEFEIHDASRAIAAHAAKELAREQWVRLTVSGDASESKRALSEIVVDLAAREKRTGEAGDVEGVARHILEHGNSLLKPSHINSRAESEFLRSHREAVNERRQQRLHKLILENPRWSPQRIEKQLDDEERTAPETRVERPLAPPVHFVIIGGPGQGKTTLGQLLCQVYRVALLTGHQPSALGPAAEIRRRLEQRFTKLRLPIPGTRRWPIRIVLSKFSDSLVDGDSTSILAYIAQEIAQQSNVPVNAYHLERWLHNWPWLIVLDGLDEIADPEARATVQDKVTDLLIDAGRLDADVLVVGTTRPQGYLDEFQPEHFTSLVLKTFDRESAIGYASDLHEVRHAGDPDMQDQLETGIREALDNPITARLMSTPLQVAIMSLLLERRARAPENRYQLFEAYFDTIYSREIAKRGSLGDLLSVRRNDILFIHQRVALLLQMRAEDKGESESLMSNDDLVGVATRRLCREGASAADAKQLAKRLLAAATDRLVLLVPLVQDKIGFEVRSLQEFMTAQALITTSDENLIARLKVTATASFWRNTWLLAAGNVFQRRPYLRTRIVALFDEVNSESILATLLQPSWSLALDLLEDDVPGTASTYRRMVIKHSLLRLNFHPTDQVERLANVLQRATQEDEESRQIVRQSTLEVLRTSDHRRLSGLFFLGWWSDFPGPDQSWASSILRETVASLPVKDLNALASIISVYPTRALANLVQPIRGTLVKNSDDVMVMLRPLLERADDDPSRLAARRLLRRRLPRRAALNDLIFSAQDIPESEVFLMHEELVRISGELPIDAWRVASRIRNGVEQWYAQRKVSKKLAEMCPEDE